MSTTTVNPGRDSSPAVRRCAADAIRRARSEPRFERYRSPAWRTFWRASEMAATSCASALAEGRTAQAMDWAEAWWLLDALTNRESERAWAA